MMNLRTFLFSILMSLPVCFLSGQKLQQATLSKTHFQIDNWQMDQGLPVNSILTIAQTADGWLFFGTEEGLVRFDGNAFLVMNKSGIPGLTTNFISTLLAGRDTSLWIGTDGSGLIRYKNNDFLKYDKSNGLSDDRIFALCEDSKGGLWIGTLDGGLNYLKNEKISRYDSTNGFASNYIRAFAIDAWGRVWVGTQKGLSVIDEGQITNYFTNDGLSDDFIETLAFDKEQNLWIGTKSGGLNRLKQDKFTVFTTQNGLTNNAVTSLCFDEKGILWIGTNGGGITRMMQGNFYPLTTKDGLSSEMIVTLFNDREGNIWAGSSGAGINRIKKKSIETFTTSDGLPGDVILPVFEDHQGILWMGIAGCGINRLENGKIQSYDQNDGLPDFLALTICEDKDNTLWIGTAGGGLTSLKNGKFTTLTTANGLSNNVVIAVTCDKSGSLWAGTTGGGINQFNDGKFTAITTKDGLSHDNISCILEDKEGNLWVGTNDGLNKINDHKITVLNTESGLSDDYILSLFEDADGNLWVGTAANGFNLIRDEKITQFTTNDGLINEVVLKILEDDFGYFWISCNKGIYKIRKQDLIDFADGKIKKLLPVSYGKTDGMETTECNGGVSPAGCKTQDGKLLFPTMKGISIIDPKKMNTVDSCFSPVFIQEFLVDGQLVKKANPLSVPSYSKRLEFRFAALNYSNPERIRYRCMLTGFDKDWIDCGTQRVVYYTNIPGGNYNFKVMASNETGQWNEQIFSELKFRLKPPFYRSVPFYLIVAVFVLLLLFFVTYYFIARFQRSRLKILVEERTRELHQKMAAQEQTEHELKMMNEVLILAKDRAEESDRLKSAFLANMSHEIRTPMNGILGFSELLKNPGLTGEQQHQYLAIIEKSGHRMLNTINELIEISKIDARQVKMEYSDTNIPEMADFLYNFFKPEMEKKNLAFKMHTPPEPGALIIKTDKEKLHAILINLLKNAMKYTRKGSVEFGYSFEKESVKYFVKDTGIGIPKNRQQAIFDRFVQADIEDKNAMEGSGLGLAISKAYCEMLGGQILVDSDTGEGATFWLTIPANQNRNIANESVSGNEIKEEEGITLKNLIVLIAEDDEISDLYLTEILKTECKEILHACTGKETIEKLMNNPHIRLILLDIKMPDMNGYETTRKIRTFNKDVVIIAQTAHAHSNDRDKALEAGCNDYLTKPIRKNVLFGKIKKFGLN